MKYDAPTYSFDLSYDPPVFADFAIVAHRQPRCPWGTTFRVYEDGAPWMTRCGCRIRAWSTRAAAQTAIDLECIRRSRA